MKHLLFVILCALIVAVILGCGETEDPLEMEVNETAETGTLAAMKTPDGAPAAPTMPQAGTPFVKQVGFYSDWKRTKVLTGPVKPGSTIHINIVFSEGMKLVIADDKEARPILYYKIGEKLRRFKVVGYKAKSKDFTSGDAKPVGNQATYYARYAVKQADVGNIFTVAVGKFSADRQGNTLADFYTHDETLQCGPLPPKETPKEDPQEQPTDTVSPSVLSITHSYDSEPITGELPDGATVETEIVFSERVTPAITYTTGDETNTYRVSQAVGGVHWRGLCKPADNTGTIWLCRQSVAQPSFTITVTTDTVDLAGNRLQEEAATEAVPVTEQATPPQEPVQEPTQPPVQTPIDTPDTPPTTPQDPALPPTQPDTPLQQAIAVVKRYLERWSEIKPSVLTEAQKKQKEVGRFPWPWFDSKINEVRIEETGLDYFTVGFSFHLADIYVEVYAHARERIRSGDFSTRGMSVEYLRLYFTHPEKTKEELLILYRQSVIDGKVSIEKGQFF